MIINICIQKPVFANIRFASYCLLVFHQNKLQDKSVWMLIWKDHETVYSNCSNPMHKVRYYLKWRIKKFIVFHAIINGKSARNKLQSICIKLLLKHGHKPSLVHLYQSLHFFLWSLLYQSCCILDNFPVLYASSCLSERYLSWCLVLPFIWTFQVFDVWNNSLKAFVQIYISVI